MEGACFMHPGLLIGAGVLLGTAGSKIITSRPARRLYVGATRVGLKVRDGVEAAIDGAKAEADDILAEAEYLNETEACYCGCCADPAEDEATTTETQNAEGVTS
jgi:hypothetical protein